MLEALAPLNVFPRTALRFVIIFLLLSSSSVSPPSSAIGSTKDKGTRRGAAWEGGGSVENAAVEWRGVDGGWAAPTGGARGGEWERSGNARAAFHLLSPPRSHFPYISRCHFPPLTLGHSTCPTPLPTAHTSSSRLPAHVVRPILSRSSRRFDPPPAVAEFPTLPAMLGHVRAGVIQRAAGAH